MMAVPLQAGPFCNGAVCVKEGMCSQARGEPIDFWR